MERDLCLPENNEVMGKPQCNVSERINANCINPTQSNVWIIVVKFIVKELNGFFLQSTILLVIQIAA